MFSFDNCFDVSSNDRSGGFALFWKNYFNCIVFNYSDNHINVEAMTLVVGNGNLQVFMDFKKVVEDEILGIFLEVYLIILFYLGVY
jgi:hypothetical protein